MIEDINEFAVGRMQKALDNLHISLNKIRTGRPHASLLDSITIDYYGAETPLHQLAGIKVEDGRSLVVSPWEKQLLPAIEKAISSSDLGLNPSGGKEEVRITMPLLTEETRRNFVRQARDESEHARVAVRGARREAIARLKRMVKEAEIGKDEEFHAEADMQKLTDRFIGEVDTILAAKEAELMEV